MSISTRLDFLANHFGGYQEVVKLLPASDLNIIASFCGPVSVNSIASLINETTTDPIDLLELGYIANSTYYVHNSRYEYLFSGQVDRYFAASAEIKKLALTAPHGSYYYITFTLERAVCGSREVERTERTVQDASRNRACRTRRSARR